MSKNKAKLYFFEFALLWLGSGSFRIKIIGGCEKRYSIGFTFAAHKALRAARKKEYLYFSHAPIDEIFNTTGEDFEKRGKIIEEA